jgi:transcriptional regulator with PAS, ATPase and Fis domain
VKKITTSPVLVRGESGTGKELVARLIHTQSPRAFGPLVAVNCGALPEGLLESELFGHEKGSFTGAAGQRKGKLELADGGTLFLDEIGEIPAKVQVELLRALEDHKITRVGGSQEIKIDFRVICATNRDLEEAVREGTFREDLYYRINVFEIDIPPLRERPEDILPIAEHFLKKFSSSMGRRVTGLSPSARVMVLKYQWPGNVRELANAIERALVVCRGEEIEPQHLPILARSASQDGGDPDDLSMQAIEKKHIVRVLKLNEFNVTHTAKALEIDRVTLYNKMRKYKIERPAG